MIRVSVLERNSRFIKILYTSNGLSQSIMVKPQTELSDNQRKNAKIWKARRKEGRMVCPVHISNKKLSLIKAKAI